MSIFNDNNVTAAIASGVAVVISATTVAAVHLVSSSSSHHVRLAEVPRQFAFPTKTQIRLVKLAYKVGPHSRTYYRWGGTSRYGFDCSGFTQYLYRHAAHTSIPRTSESQYVARSGERVPRRQERAGDLVFFSGAYGNYYLPGHVGIYVGNGRYIEFYRTGYRARVNYLSEFSRGYLGAHRWYKPVRVPSHLLNYVDMLAQKYHVRVMGSFVGKHWDRWAIDFSPRSKRMWRWAKSQHLKVEILPHRVRLFLRPFPH